jgi:hypothetical protein
MFCAMHSAGEWSCDCFVGFVETDRLRSVPNVNDAGESMLVMPIVTLTLGFRDCMLSLRWLIPLALEGGVIADVQYLSGMMQTRYVAGNR